MGSCSPAALARCPQVTGKCGSVTVRLIPAPRGAGIVAARVPKKVLQMAGIEDCYTSARGSTKTLGNFVKVPPVPASRPPPLL